MGLIENPLLCGSFLYGLLLPGAGQNALLYFINLVCRRVFAQRVLRALRVIHPCETLVMLTVPGDRGFGASLISQSLSLSLSQLCLRPAFSSFFPSFFTTSLVFAHEDTLSNSEPSLTRRLIPAYNTVHSWRSHFSVAYFTYCAKGRKCSALASRRLEGYLKAVFPSRGPRLPPRCRGPAPEGTRIASELSEAAKRHKSNWFDPIVLRRFLTIDCGGASNLNWV